MTKLEMKNDAKHLLEIVRNWAEDGIDHGIEPEDCERVKEYVEYGIELISDYQRVLAPMKPKLKGNMWECPVCHHPVGIYQDDDWCDYCPQCGKAMMWSESE